MVECSFINWVVVGLSPVAVTCIIVIYLIITYIAIYIIIAYILLIMIITIIITHIMHIIAITIITTTVWRFYGWVIAAWHRTAIFTGLVSHIEHNSYHMTFSFHSPRLVFKSKDLVIEAFQWPNFSRRFFFFFLRGYLSHNSNIISFLVYVSLSCHICFRYSFLFLRSLSSFSLWVPNLFFERV